MKISVVTPSYNQAPYLRATLESIHTQNYQDLEHWVMDGGSTDGSVDVLREYAAAGKLRFLSGPDGGQADALNQGLARCQGEVLTWLCSDDLFTPGALQRVADWFSSHPGQELVTGDCVFLDPSGQTLHRSSARGQTRERLIRVEQVPFQPSTFFRRSLLERHGALNPTFHYALDYELWLRFTRDCHFHYLPAELSCYRLHPTSKSSQENYRTFLPEVVRASRWHWGYPLTFRWWARARAVSLHCSRVYYEAALAARGRGDEISFLRLLNRAVMHAPWRTLYWKDLASLAKRRFVARVKS